MTTTNQAWPFYLGLLVGGVLLTDCSVQYPVKWEARSEKASELVHATEGIPYGMAPQSWDLPGNDKILIDISKATVNNGLGMYSADIAFTARYVSTPPARLECRTDPAGPGVPSTRFGCWSTDGDEQQVVFWLAPEEKSCRSVWALDVWTEPACWQGILEIGGRRIRLSHGSSKSFGTPAGYVSWVDDEDDLLLTARFVSDQSVRFFDRHSSSRPIAAKLRRRLVLLTVALQVFEDLADPN